jgi:hypothetical protein
MSANVVSRSFSSRASKICGRIPSARAATSAARNHLLGDAFAEGNRLPQNGDLIQPRAAPA